MTAVEYLVEKLKLESIDLSKWHNNLIDKAKEMERNQIIRACNHCKENSFLLLQQAIKERKSIGEVYYNKMIKDESK
jgi:hypothetical protein